MPENNRWGQKGGSGWPTTAYGVGSGGGARGDYHKNPLAPKTSSKRGKKKGQEPTSGVTN